MRKLKIKYNNHPLTIFPETETMETFIDWIDAMTETDKKQISFEVVED